MSKNSEVIENSESMNNSSHHFHHISGDFPRLTSFSEPVESSFCTMSEGTQGFRCLGDVGIATWDGAVRIIIIHIKKHHMQTEVPTTTGLLQVGRADVMGLVWYATGEKVDSFHL